jgi:diguanylate cyclase (GGDEF)-like protein
MTVFCALALTALFVLAMSAVCRRVLIGNYREIEERHVSDDYGRLVALLNSQVNALDHTALDYATWDRTYKFMRVPSKDYIRAEISDDTFVTYGIRLFMLVSADGQIALQKTYGLEASKPEFPPEDIQQLLLAARHVMSRKTNGASGLLALSDGPGIISLRPILKTDQAGPSRGVLIMLRRIDQQTVAQWSLLAQLKFRVEVAKSDVPPMTVLARPTQATAGAPVVTATENALSIDSRLGDIWGQPTLHLLFTHTREITQQGATAARLLLLLLGLLGLLFSLLNLCLIQRYVIRRVERLMWLTQQAHGENGPHVRVHMSGSDELAQLGRGLNQMLDRLQNSQQKLLAVQERLRFEATHDALTGIWNRAAALELMDRELARCERENSSLAVIMFDADHFKRINDHFGHTAGDRALQATSAAITRNLRAFDICARYGGEEFLVIAPCCAETDAQQLAARILEHVRTFPIVVADHAFSLTLSAGVTVSAPGCNPEDLIVVADRALYRAKEKGRDRAEFESTSPTVSAAGTRFTEARGRAI